MLRLRSYLTVLVVLATAMLSPRVLTAQKVDVTGKWQFTVTTDAGTGSPTVTFKQQGDSLTGHYSSQVLGESDFKGTLKDGKIASCYRSRCRGRSCW